MVHLGKILRWLFALNAFLFAVLCGRFLWSIPAFSGFDTAAIVIATTQPICYLMTALAFGTAFCKLGKGGTDARWWAFSASALSIFLYWTVQAVPFWPAVGIVGLIVFARRGTIEAMVAEKPRQTRVRGDGTSGSLNGFANIAMIAGCVAACYFWSAWAGSHQLAADDNVLLWALYIEIATLVTTLGHESGHALAARVLNMKIRRFVVGPVSGAFRSGHWKLDFAWAGFLGAPGAVGMVPANTDNLRNRHAMVAAAGPLASLLLGLITAWMALDSKGQPWESAWRLFAFTATFSLLSFAFNLIPAGPESIYSDGARVYQLLRRGEWADLHLALSMASCTLASATRPRDLDIAVIERATNFMTSGMEALLLRMQAKSYFHDCGMVPEALEALADAERVYEKSELDLRVDLHKGFVFANAFLKRDAEAARVWWERMEAKKNATVDADYWISYAALQWIEGNLDEARVGCEMSGALMRELPQVGAYNYDRDCLAQLQEVVDASRSRSRMMIA